MSLERATGVAEGDPHWGSANRDQKARNILECLGLLTELNLATQSCVDIGCGSGGISFHLAPSFNTVCGVDQEPWQRWQEYMSACPNLSFREESIESLSLADESIDVVICNQVYEHVRSPEVLIAQIHRILKPDGVCYFAGPNLLHPIEPHVHWPFVHWLPRRLAQALLGIFAPGKILDSRATTYWGLRSWLHEFIILDAVPQLIKHRAESPKAVGIWRFFRHIPHGVLKVLAFLSPGFIFLIHKPDNGGNEES